MAETLIHGLYGWPNLADLTLFTGPAGYYVEEDVINYNGQSYNAGHFEDPTAPNVPGIPGRAANEGGQDNYAQEILAVLEFAEPGLYTMGVNCDKGFRTTVGNPKEATRGGMALVLGEEDGGRTNLDCIFHFRILQPGLYPFRTLWEQGTGGHNVEWFTMPATCQYVLINDRVNPDAIKAYQYPILTTKGSPYVKSFTPARSSAYFNTNNAAGARTGTDAAIRAVLVDGETAVDTASVKLQLDGVDVTPTVSKTGTETTVSYQPPVPVPFAPSSTHAEYRRQKQLAYNELPAPFAPGSTHRVDLTFLDRTVTWSFVVGSLRSARFFIEAEDFNYDGGKSRPEASLMPYMGGAYAGLGAVAGIDYQWGGSEPWSPLYRYGEQPEVPMYRTNDRDRNVGELQVNYNIGWTGAGQWFNYTRDFPPGRYNVYAAVSYDNSDAGACHATLQRVAGAATPNQTLTELGVFDAQGTHDIGGWGANALVPLKDATGEFVSLDLSGPATLRYTPSSGDWDYMLFIPDMGDRWDWFKFTNNGDGTMTLEWNGGGTIQAAISVLGPWVDVPGVCSPFTVILTERIMFLRLER
jgi:hypothetical protein